MIITELQINDTVEQQLHLVASRQIPFAAAASLTAVAKIAQAEVRNHINETFTIRRKSGGFAREFSGWKCLCIRTDMACSEYSESE